MLAPLSCFAIKRKVQLNMVTYDKMSKPVQMDEHGYEHKHEHEHKHDRKEHDRNVAERELSVECDIPLILIIEDSNFLLVPTKVLSSLEKLMILYEESVVNYSIAQLFRLIRKDNYLEEIHNLSEREEMVLRIPKLGVTISEDNIYCREILIRDFILIFKALDKLGHLKFLLSGQQRFITEFNDLNDAIRMKYNKRRKPL